MRQYQFHVAAIGLPAGRDRHGDAAYIKQPPSGESVYRSGANRYSTTPLPIAVLFALSTHRLFFANSPYSPYDIQILLAYSQRSSESAIILLESTLPSLYLRYLLRAKL
jgi:hypothetical protein